MRSLPRESSPVHAPCPSPAPAIVHLMYARLADLLAWLNDSPTNELDGYPGPGWQSNPGPVR